MGSSDTATLRLPPSSRTSLGLYIDPPKHPIVLSIDEKSQNQALDRAQPGAVHRHPKVRAWFGRHPRWTFHFTPTSVSWLNAVKTLFSAVTPSRPAGRRASERRRDGAPRSTAATPTRSPSTWTSPPLDRSASMRQCTSFALHRTTLFSSLYIHLTTRRILHI
jgi:hypothetical protein